MVYVLFSLSLIMVEIQIIKRGIKSFEKIKMEEQIDYMKSSDNTIDLIIRKRWTEDWRKIQKNIKPKQCILCKEIKTSYCNSHTIPQFILKNIAKSGLVGTPNAIIKLPNSNILDDSKGVKNSGVIHFICNLCDSKYFKEYENPQKLKTGISDKMLAEIALKNFLLELSRIRLEKENLNNTLKNNSILTSRPFELQNFQNWDIEDFENEVEEHKKNIVTNNIGAYQVICRELLPYKVPLAFQDSISVIEDMDGNGVNDTTDLSAQNRIQKLHVAILPLKDSTVVLAFYHKKDRKYRGLRHQMNSVLQNKKLEFINYLIFAYSENYFFSLEREKDFISNPKLSQLSQELFGRPNLGFQILENRFEDNYQKVRPDEIPNFLLKEWSLKG